AVGGMAEIYLAIDQRYRDRELVVVKRIRQDLGNNKEFVEMFLDETELIRRLDHPNIIRLLDCGRVEGRYFIALEHVWGESLGQLSRMCLQQQGRFPLAPALWVGVEVARGLEHAHARRDSGGEPAPVIHRDVTTENIAISYQGDVKILDFGIAKAKDRLARTRIGQIKGTLSYLAPEQLLGEETSPQTDIYQLGAMLYQTLLGRLPVDGKNPLELMKAIVGNQIVKPSAVVPGFPERVERALLKAMAREPDQRFADAGEMQQVLRQLLGNAYSDGRARLVQFIARVTGDRHQRQQEFIGSVLQGLEVSRQVGDLFDWAAGDDAKTLTDAAGAADVRTLLERSEIEATDPSIPSPYATGDEHTDRSESPELAVKRRLAFQEIETLSARPPADDEADGARIDDTVSEHFPPGLPQQIAREQYETPLAERSGDEEVFRTREREPEDRSIPAPVTMPNIDVARLMRDEIADRGEVAAAEGRGATGERLFNELLADSSNRSHPDAPPRSLPELTPVATVIATPEAAAPAPASPAAADGVDSTLVVPRIRSWPAASGGADVPIEDRPTALHALGPALLAAADAEPAASAPDAVIDLDRPKPPPVVPPIVELRVRKEGPNANDGSAAAEFDPLSFPLPQAAPAEFDLAAVATELEEQAVELSEFSRLARTQRFGWLAMIATFSGVVALGAGLMLLWPLLTRQSASGPVTGRGTAADGATRRDASAAAAKAVPPRVSAGDAGSLPDHNAQRTDLSPRVDVDKPDRARAGERPDGGSAPRNRPLGRLIVDAGSESAVTHEANSSRGRSTLPVRQPRGRVFLTRVSNDVVVRLDYEVVDDEVKLHVESEPTTDVSYNGYAIGPTPKSLVLGNQFRIMLSSPKLGQPFKLDVAFEAEP
ncbi:MAG: serine/threonine protein kinase, partial [Deltaproteobacteria bacterium]|nr:serine/threonine protein kinase [Deltaproteobacteria bacterium]